VASKSKTEADLEARIAEFRNDEERVEVLRRTRRFKSSWVELAETLSQVLSRESFKRWGYETFEDYCRKELHLRRDTALKLTGSYSFLKSHAPRVLDRDGIRAPIPSLESVSFWRDTALGPKRDEVGAETMRDLRHAVLEEGLPAGSLRRRFQEALLDPEEREERDRAALLASARRLKELLAESRIVPRAMAEELEDYLEKLIEKLQTE
jgi:hypothetical protein